MVSTERMIQAGRLPKGIEIYLLRGMQGHQRCRQGKRKYENYD